MAKDATGAQALQALAAKIDGESITLSGEFKKQALSATFKIAGIYSGGTLRITTKDDAGNLGEILVVPLSGGTTFSTASIAPAGAGLRFHQGTRRNLLIQEPPVKDEGHLTAKRLTRDQIQKARLFN